MAEALVSPGMQVTETDRSYVAGKPLVAGAALIGPTVQGPVKVPTKVISYGDYIRKFGTTFEIENADGVLEAKEFMTSLAAKSYFEQGGDSLLVVRVADTKAFQSAKSTDIASMGEEIAGEDPYLPSGSFELYTISTGELLNSVNHTGSFIPYPSASADERKDGSLVSGTPNNLRWEIYNVNPDAGTFSLVLRRGDDTAANKIVLESFNNLSLDPNSGNYIAKVIGDQRQSMMIDEAGLPYIDVIGDYANKSNYIYVKVLRPTLNYLENDGYTVRKDLQGHSLSAYLPKEQEGAFHSGAGKVGVAYNNGEVVENADIRYFGEITETTEYPQSVKADDYQDAIDLLYNDDEYQINMVSAPGLLGKDSMKQVDNLISLSSTRGDNISVVDLVCKGAMPSVVAEAASKFNSSYAATYWPWLQMYSNTGKLEWVPASVVIPGVYTFTDHSSAPWFAPAGMTRGSVQGVVQTERKLTKASRDVLYLKNVNPIATFPGSGIVIYGQKTLQKKASALDRVNVRRLLIELKKKVKDMASGLLFENNTLALRNSFRAKLEPYLESVVQRQGLYAYKVVLDELNDADAIDRNEFRCQVYLQPAKSIEFIYIDFTITATGVEFN